MTIKKALQTIKGYCEKHLGCRRCPLSDYGQSLCPVNEDIPADWDVEEMLKNWGGDSDEVHN